MVGSTRSPPGSPEPWGAHGPGFVDWFTFFSLFSNDRGVRLRVNIPDTLGTTAVWLGCMRADPGIMQCLIFGGGDLTRACKSSLGKLETPVEVAWRYNRTDLFPLFAARGIEIPSGRPPQDLMESFISGMPTS